MRINYFSPVAISLAVLPRMLERRSGTIVNVSSLGGRLGITTEAAYSGSKFALAGWSESMAIDLDRTGRLGQVDPPRAPSTPRSGTSPTTTRRSTTGPKEPPESIAGGIVDAIDSERFEHYLPDMKAVIEIKTSDIDAFMVGMRALAGSRTRRRPAREGPALRCAARPRTRSGPTPEDELETMLAGIPFGLHEIDDARLVRPDWVVTRPDPLGHLRLRRQARAGRLQHRRHRQPDGRLLVAPPRPGARGGGRGGRTRARGAWARRRPTGRAQPVADLRAARHRPAVPALPGGRPQPVLELHQG